MQKRRLKKKLKNSSSKSPWFLQWKPVYLLFSILMLLGIGLYAKVKHPTLYARITKPIRHAQRRKAVKEPSSQTPKRRWNYLELLENEEPFLFTPPPPKEEIHYQISCCSNASSPQCLESYRAQLALLGIETTWSIRANTPQLLLKGCYPSKQAALQRLKQLRKQFPFLEFYVVSAANNP